MSKVAVVYWSSTGNTEAMANAVVDGAKEKGADVTLYECADFRPELVGEYDAIAFGCPAMGDEVLEEDEFEPMFDGCKAELKDKKIALFGSYGWGDGEWMRNWEIISVSSAYKMLVMLRAVVNEGTGGRVSSCQGSDRSAPSSQKPHDSSAESSSYEKPW